jgi:hypothetical protein
VRPDTELQRQRSLIYSEIQSLDPSALANSPLQNLQAGYAEMAMPVREERAEAAKLERRLSDLVNQAYGLTPEEVDLLWSTAPPRMPKF